MVVLLALKATPSVWQLQDRVWILDNLGSFQSCAQNRTLLVYFESFTYKVARWKPNEHRPWDPHRLGDMRLDGKGYCADSLAFDQVLDQSDGPMADWSTTGEKHKVGLLGFQALGYLQPCLFYQMLGVRHKAHEAVDGWVAPTHNPTFCQLLQPLYWKHTVDVQAGISMVVVAVSHHQVVHIHIISKGPVGPVPMGVLDVERFLVVQVNTSGGYKSDGAFGKGFLQRMPVDLLVAHIFGPCVPGAHALHPRQESLLVSFCKLPGFKINGQYLSPLEDHKVG